MEPDPLGWARFHPPGTPGGRAPVSMAPDRVPRIPDHRHRRQVLPPTGGPRDERVRGPCGEPHVPLGGPDLPLADQLAGHLPGCPGRPRAVAHSGGEPSRQVPGEPVTVRGNPRLPPVSASGAPRRTSGPPSPSLQKVRLSSRRIDDLDRRCSSIRSCSTRGECEVGETAGQALFLNPQGSPQTFSAIPRLAALLHNVVPNEALARDVQKRSRAGVQRSSSSS
jgi:hypothetical protein